MAIVRIHRLFYVAIALTTLSAVLSAGWWYLSFEPRAIEYREDIQKWRRVEGDIWTRTTVGFVTGVITSGLPIFSILAILYLANRLKQMPRESRSNALADASPVTMTYSPIIAKSITSDSVPEIEYVWDELSDNVIEEYEDGVLSVSYDHEPGLYGNLLSQNRNGVTSYYHYDGRGDTVALTDDAGNVTDTKEYDAWGNVIASTGSTVSSYQFIGRNGYTIDQTAQLHYIRRRYYKANAARWISDDPIRISPTHMDQFVYANNTPLSMSDPSGLIISTILKPPTVWPCGTSRITTIARFSMTWSISLDKPAPCNGWFVQQIVAWVGVTECPVKWPFLERDCCHPPTRRDYWGVNEVVSLEASRVSFNSKAVTPDNWRLNRLPYLKGSFSNYCGEYTVIAKGRFFCESETGDLNKVWKSEKPGEGAGDPPVKRTYDH